MKICNIKITLLLLLVISSLSNANTYTLVIEPTFPIEQGKQVYEPLRDWLSKKTGHDVEIIIDNNYYSYWRSANGSRMPDFTYDAPHVAGFRATKKRYKPIATTIEELSFHLISLDIPAKEQSNEEFLVNKNVVMLPSPSLATIYFNQWFTDLFSTPKRDVTALSWQETVEIVFDGSAQAAIVPDWMFNLYPNFASLQESEKIPGSTFMASPDLPPEVVDSFQKALLSLVDDEAAYDVLVELNTEGFKKPESDKYQDLVKLLPRVF
ncbi:MAG: phosphate/phosphite/phosphonate ABC transporter substrate-binding protein [Marinicellaceae bacterium]